MNSLCALSAYLFVSLFLRIFPPFPLLLERPRSSLICCASLGTFLPVSAPALPIHLECIHMAAGVPSRLSSSLSCPSCPSVYPQTHFTGQFPLIRETQPFPSQNGNCRFIKISLTSIPPVALWGSGLSQKSHLPASQGPGLSGSGMGLGFWFASSRQYSGHSHHPCQPSPPGGQGREEGLQRFNLKTCQGTEGHREQREMAGFK